MKLDNTSRDHLTNSILNRRLFKYKNSDLLNYFAMCICVRKSRTLRDVQGLDQHWRFELGQQKLQRELDVIKVLRAIRDIRLLKQATLHSSDAMLLKFQRQRMIQSEESDRNDQFNFQELLEDNTTEIRLQALSKLRKSMNELCNRNLGCKELMLINGIYQSKPVYVNFEDTPMRSKFKQAISEVIQHRTLKRGITEFEKK